MNEQPGGSAGFTLLELLVAITVLGILTGLLASGLGFGARVWERERGQLDAATDLQIAQDVLRRTITQAWPMPAGPESGERTPSFVGTATSVEFLGPPPAQSLVGGLYAYTVLTRQDAGSLRLVLTWRLRTPDGKPPKTRVTNAALSAEEMLLSGREVVLLDGLESAEFGFFGASDAGGAPAWLTEWRSPDKLPQAVRLHIAFPLGDRRSWPELLVATRISATSGE